MTDHDLHEDESLKTLLRASAPEPPFDDVDWAALHTRITAAAAPYVQRPTGGWWRQLAGWSPRGIPAAAVAAALVMLLLGDVVRPGPVTVAGADTFPTIEEELADALDGTVPLFVSGSDNVIDALLFHEVNE